MPCICRLRFSSIPEKSPVLISNGAGVGLVGVERIRLSDAMRSDYRVRLDGYGCYGWCGQVEIVVEIKNKPYNGYNGRNELSKDQPLNHTSPSTG